MVHRSIAALLVLAGCGDNLKPAPGPGPLVADPAVQVGCLPRPAAGETRAKVIACSDELIGGRLAAGRVGDFVLENDRIRVVVRAAGEGYYQHGSWGGGIVDAAAVGGEDLIKELQPVVDLAVGAYAELVIVEAGDDGPAELVVRGPATNLEVVSAALSRDAPPLVIEHHYRLAAGTNALELETFVFEIAGGEATSHDLYDAMFMGGRAPAFLPGHGFAAGNSGEMVATGGTTTSYGLVYPAQTPSPQLVDLAGIRLVLGPPVDAAGQRRWLVLGDGSVSSVTERGWELRGTPLGVVTGTTTPGVDVVVVQADAPITIARAAADGTFRVALPAGAYALHAEAVGREPGAAVPVTVVGGAPTIAVVAAGASGTIGIEVRDDQGAAIPARVVLTAPGRDRRILWAGVTGDLDASVEPGTWRVAISRGLEYDAFVASAVVVTDGQRAAVSAQLARVVDTSGWISLDTHLHSEQSSDSTFPLDDRLRAVAAEGVEVPVSTDHDILTDYAPVIAELGLESWLGTLIGVEASSIIWGHINGFPLVVDPARTGGGAPHWYARSPGEVFAALHAGGAGAPALAPIVQVNHPRRGSTALFDAIDLDAANLVARRDPSSLGLPAGTNLSDLSFDAVEVANAKSSDSFEPAFADWLALVAAGHPAAATGSSDSHGASTWAGEARTYVYVGPGNDVPATVDHAAIVAAIHGRRVVVGTGAFVTAGIVTNAGTSLPGDTVDVTGAAEVTLHVQVQAAGWQPLQAIRIYQGTQQIRSIPLDPQDTATVRFDADVVLPTPAASTFWVVRVDGGGPGDPVLDAMLPAFTNPVFGQITP